MSKEFKIGDRVWFDGYKCYGTIIRIGPKEYMFPETYYVKYDKNVLNKGKNGYLSSMLQKTAETMLKELGFEKTDELKNYLYSDGGEFYTYYGCNEEKNKYYQYRVFVFDKYYIVDKFSYDSSAKIDKNLLKALNQLMIEMEAGNE